MRTYASPVKDDRIWINTLGGKPSTVGGGQIGHNWKTLRLLTLIWRLFKIFFRYGNQEIYYHICGHPDSWDCPMEAENVEVRQTLLGPHVTIW